MREIKKTVSYNNQKVAKKQMGMIAKELHEDNCLAEERANLLVLEKECEETQNWIM